LFDSLVTALKLISLIKVPGLSEFTPYFLYCGLAIILFIALTVLITALTKKREYLSPNYACYEISSLMDYSLLISDVYAKQIKKFKEKEYFVIESMKYKSGKVRLLRIHKGLFKLLDEKVKSNLSACTNHKYLKLELYNLHKKRGQYLELETKTDFVVPYIPFNTPKNGFNDIDFVQICMRPIKSGWRKELTKLQRGLENGYDETLRWDGCIGGFVGVFYPIIKLRDDSKSSKMIDKWGNYQIQIPKSKFVNRKFEQKYSLIEKKKSDIGFDVSIRIVLHELESENKLEKILITLNTNIEEFSNSFVVSVKKRFSVKHLSKITKAHMPDDSVDLLNEKEISEVINRLIV